MSLDFENSNFANFISNGSFDSVVLENVFGPNLDWNWIENISIDSSSSYTSIVPVIYDHLNLTRESSHSWTGLHNIWKLSVIPRVKVFIWKMAHGKFPSGAYLYNIRVCPYMACKFCGLELETTSHLL